MPGSIGIDRTRRRDEQTREANKNLRSAIARLVIGETSRLDTSDDSRKSSQENHRLRPGWNRNFAKHPAANPIALGRGKINRDSVEPVFYRFTQRRWRLPSGEANRAISSLAATARYGGAFSS